MKLNIVPARTGILWVKLGVQTFLKQPLALTGLFFMYMAAVLLISQIPFLGWCWERCWCRRPPWA